MDTKNRPLRYPSPRRAAIDAAKLQDFVSTHAKKIVTVSDVH